MTREEAYKLAMQACKETWNDKTCKQIKDVLQQQPCDDCISRQAVLRILKNNRYRFNISQEGNCEGIVLWSEKLIKDDACKEIEQLPSVTPKEKTGHWIRTKDGFECSECSCISRSLADFCQYCGASMVSE